MRRPADPVWLSCLVALLWGLLVAGTLGLCLWLP